VGAGAAARGAGGPRSRVPAARLVRREQARGRSGRAGAGAAGAAAAWRGGGAVAEPSGPRALGAGASEQAAGGSRLRHAWARAAQACWRERAPGGSWAERWRSGAHGRRAEHAGGAARWGRVQTARGAGARAQERRAGESWRRGH
jgi:hypothetical protein